MIMMIDKTDEAEFIGQIIDTFEDFVEQNLPELNISKGEAFIVDDKYFNLEDQLRGVLRNWGGVQ